MSHAQEFDEYGHKDHGHVIVSLFTLRFTLVALLIFTLMTSGAAMAEDLIAATFHVEIPQWINACVALSIAVVKTTLVVMFFMQLKYDNPMNTIIFVFTVLTVFSFLGFTTLDLGNRDTMDRFKNVYAYDGGNGLDLAGTSITAKAKEQAIQRQGELEQKLRELNKELDQLKREGGSASKISHIEEEIAEIPHLMAHEGYDPAKEHHHEDGLIIQDMGYLPEKPASGSSSNASRPVIGVTIPGLPGYMPPNKAAHASGPGAGKEVPVESKAPEVSPRKEGATEGTVPPPAPGTKPATEPKPH